MVEVRIATGGDLSGAVGVWPHNAAARALYRRFGFEEEGYFRKQWRRRSGELWDSIAMGLLL